MAFHSLQALLTHMPVVLLNAGMVGWLIGILVVPRPVSLPYSSGTCFSPFWSIIAYIIWSIVALVHARKGRFFYMPLVGRFCFGRYYGAEGRDAAHGLATGRTSLRRAFEPDAPAWPGSWA